MVPRRLRLSKFFKGLEGYSAEIRRGNGRFAETTSLKVLCASLLFLCVSLCNNSCRSDSDTLNPNRPKESYTMTAEDVRNERYRSTAHVPVSIALAEVERQINAQVTGLIYEDNSLTDNGNDQFMTRVWKRSTILVDARDSLFHFTVPLRIWVKAGVSVLGFTKYTDTEFEIDLRFKTKFDLDPDWSVNTRTTPDGYSWVRRPTVSIIGLNIPITSLVSRMIDKNLDGITKTLDQQVRRNVDLRTPVLQAWNLLREPYLLSEAYRTYLQVVPSRVLITPLRFEGRVIRATIGIEGHTLTTTGARPGVQPAVSLPDLTVVPQIKDDFQIGLLSEVSYPEAARLVSQAFVGQTFKFSNDRYAITLTDIDLFGQDDNLIVKAGLKGTINGTIYLRGRPYYDPRTKTISLKDLKYDLDTRNVLFKSAGWLLQDTFARTLEKQLTIPVGPYLADAQQQIQSQLKNNRVAKGIVVNGRIDQIVPDQVYLTPTGLIAVVNAKGRVDVKIDGLL